MECELSHSTESMMQIGDVVVRYYLREPSPDCWNAVGIIVRIHDERFLQERGRSTMIVGVGSTRDEATSDLVTRIVLEEHPVLAGLSELARPLQHSSGPR